MEEAEDEPLFCERAAGIDIGKSMVMVTVRVPSEARKGGRAQETREFGTTRRHLLELADWLRSWRVERAGMESTDVIWRNEDQRRCFRRSRSHVRVRDGRVKSGIEEGLSRDRLCNRLSV